MTVTTNGTIIVPSTNEKKSRRPGKSRRVNAYAAGRLTASLPSVVATAITVLLTNHQLIGKTRNASGKFSRVGASGISRTPGRNTSAAGLKAVESIQRSGKIVSRQSRITSRCSAACPSRFGIGRGRRAVTTGWAARRLPIVDVPLDEPELEPGQQDDGQRDDDRDRARNADLEVPESLLVQVEDQVYRAIERPAVGQDRDRAEHLVVDKDDG